MKHKTQEKQVIEVLNEWGEVSRNWALQNYISRLGAIICDLKGNGWEFDPYFKTIGNSKDYIYKVTKSPFKRVDYWKTEADGSRTLLTTKYE